MNFSKRILNSHETHNRATSSVPALSERLLLRSFTSSYQQDYKRKYTYIETFTVIEGMYVVQKSK